MAFSAGCLSAIATRADVVVSNEPTQNMSCSNGVCTATAKKAVLNVSDMTSMLAVADLTVDSSTAKNIDIDASIEWSSASRLALNAKQSITVKKAVTVAGAGAVTLDYNTKDKDGELL
ncbi:MAG: hypothetical protein JO208_12780, partial [Alphaproteobacteria bacterium]|nr:hypothetical protein [Alphaproteobacteria bacterium]